MFADSLLESSWTQRTRRGWTTLTSFGLEAAVIGLLLLLPLWKTVGLPSVRTVSTPISAGRAEPGPAPTAHTTGRAGVMPTNATMARFVAPGHIPATLLNSGDDATPRLVTGCVGCVPGIGTPGTPEGVPNVLMGGNHAVVMPTTPSIVHVFRTSSILEGSLIRRVTPIYPPLARSARIQGAVVLFAVISKAGTIDRLRVVEGHPLLVPAAIQAVSQWRYHPYILNSEPIEVETQITVNFILGN